MYFLISRLAPHGVDITVFDEISQQRAPNWRSLRFLKRRGLVAFVDLMLLQWEASLASMRRSAHGKSRVDEPVGGVAEMDVSRPFLFRKSLAALVTIGEDSGENGRWFRVANMNAQATIEQIRDVGADHVLLCGAPLIRMSKFDKIGTLINCHCGIAPHYKGSSPMHWACLKRDWDNIGYTIHIATSEVDGGPIIFQERNRPRAGWTLTDLDWFTVYSMYSKLAELIVKDELRQLAANAEPQTPGIDSFPPMGMIRSRIAAHRLRSYLTGK